MYTVYSAFVRSLDKEATNLYTFGTYIRRIYEMQSTAKLHNLILTAGINYH